MESYGIKAGDFVKITVVDGQEIYGVFLKEERGFFVFEEAIFPFHVIPIRKENIAAVEKSTKKKFP